MKIVCKGNAQIKHAETGKIFTIQSDELDWEAVDGQERQMGTETHYEAMIEHPSLGTLKWGLWEYPVGAENHRETDVGSHNVIKNFEYGFEHKPE